MYEILPDPGALGDRHCDEIGVFYQALRRWFVLVAILTGQPAQAGSDGPPIESVVVFNTLCARCHEGECSGRMSFQLAEDATDEHIRRYGGDLSPERVRHLVELLRYMKERCAFFPIPLALVVDHSWGRDILDRLRSPEGMAYFLPLGRMDPSLYLVRISGLAPGVRTRAELVAADFDLVHHGGVAQDGEQDGEYQVLRFRIDEPGELFLRISTQVPITLTRVELVNSAGYMTDPE
jgi:hypothetical protein